MISAVAEADEELPLAAAVEVTEAKKVRRCGASGLRRDERDDHNLVSGLHSVSARTKSSPHIATTHSTHVSTSRGMPMGAGQARV